VYKHVYDGKSSQKIIGVTFLFSSIFFKEVHNYLYLDGLIYNYGPFAYQTTAFRFTFSDILKVV